MSIVIEGGRPLVGSVPVAGAKNAALPILAATLLADGPCVIERVPDLVDVRTMLSLLQYLGLTVERREDGSVYVAPGEGLLPEAPYELVSRMRASFLVTGPLLARLGQVTAALPGGCAIGTRPVDLHLKGMEALGAFTELRGGEVHLSASRLQGSVIYLDFPSVTATENLMMAASLAPGRTIIENAAREPEVADLAKFLNTMGAQVQGAATPRLEITGRSSLGGARHRVIADRIEAGTYLLAAGRPGSDITVTGLMPGTLNALTAKLQEAGLGVAVGPDSIRVLCWRRPAALDVRTMPYPGFPTDLQAPGMAFLTTAEGTSMITETVFENRFRHAAELRRMGADITLDGRIGVVRGVPGLSGARVTASDLRAGAALVIASLGAAGTTEISGVEHIARGYDSLPAKLAALGAAVTCRRSEATLPLIHPLTEEFTGSPTA